MIWMQCFFFSSLSFRPHCVSPPLHRGEIFWVLRIFKSASLNHPSSVKSQLLIDFFWFLDYLRITCIYSSFFSMIMKKKNLQDVYWVIFHLCPVEAWTVPCTALWDQADVAKERRWQDISIRNICYPKERGVILSYSHNHMGFKLQKPAPLLQVYLKI